MTTRLLEEAVKQEAGHKGINRFSVQTRMDRQFERLLDYEYDEGPAVGHDVVNNVDNDEQVMVEVASLAVLTTDAEESDGELVD